MTFEQAFGAAMWISAEERDIYPVIRKNFDIREGESAILRILGFGSFVFYLNGKKGTDEYFLPLNSDFEARNNFPYGERTAHRCYFCEYDITKLLKGGENTLSVILCEGWYSGTRGEPKFGDRKLCFEIVVTDIEGNKRSVVSDLDARYAPTFLKNGDFTYGEDQDYSIWDGFCLSDGFDDSTWKKVVAAHPLDTEYYRCDCPTDKLIKRIAPKVISRSENTVVYDVGENISGFPVIEGNGDIKVTFSEEIKEDGSLNYSHGYGQFLTVKNARREYDVSPVGTWFGFRYFAVEGEGDVKYVAKVHADVKVSSNFECSNPVLNWIYNTYLNTQLCNMHSGIPSDCPHIERRGYTGDGQLTCRAAMVTLDAKDFYDKWIDDISDCQDRISGHVQYTAPYTKSGGGPGGWGAAIVIVPYEYWKYYDDDSKIRAMYPQMLHYFEYLEGHSEDHLVVSDSPGAWCLGEWCTPAPVILPSPFVNNYFYVVAMKKTVEIARYLGKNDDITELERRIEERKKAITAAYFNTWDGNFLGNVQGANAFALDIGLGDNRTREKFIAYYDKLGHYDTGIFGTDIVTRLLFEYGRADIAVRLMSASDPWGFGKWQRDGATTFWEYWNTSRSHSHPMFGAVTAYLFEYILGIRLVDSRIELHPMTVDMLDRASGFVTINGKKISVSYAKQGDGTLFSIEIDDGATATLILEDKKEKQISGKVSFLVKN